MDLGAFRDPGPYFGNHWYKGRKQKLGSEVRILDGGQEILL